MFVGILSRAQADVAAHFWPEGSFYVNWRSLYLQHMDAGLKMWCTVREDLLFQQGINYLLLCHLATGFKFHGKYGSWRIVVKYPFLTRYCMLRNEWDCFYWICICLLLLCMSCFFVFVFLRGRVFWGQILTLGILSSIDILSYLSLGNPKYSI